MAIITCVTVTAEGPSQDGVLWLLGRVQTKCETVSVPKSLQTKWRGNIILFTDGGLEAQKARFQRDLGT